MGSKALGVSVLNEMFSISPQSLVGVITIDDSNDVRCALPQFSTSLRRAVASR
ncbi:MAG: hypothetical protein HC797_08985 [Anaerolineales bacterium]|nr:hypothetical protein [Anaerolineales bacterium]